MFLAHLPAGYIVTLSLQKRFKEKNYLAVGLLASVFPDIDLLYFYLVDQRQTLHHEYWTHIPLYWLLTWMICMVVATALKRRQWVIVSTIIAVNLITHFFLDTFVGGIAWLHPFVEKSFFLLVVPARYTFWAWNFIFHWTFVFELAIIVTAITLIVTQQKKGEVANTLPRSLRSN